MSRTSMTTASLRLISCTAAKAVTSLPARNGRISSGHSSKAPLARARYLVELSGVDVAAETNTTMPPAFLMQQMAWREGLEEARRLGDACGLIRMDIELKRDMDAAYATLVRQFERGETAAAAMLVRKLMFLDRLNGEIADARDNVNPMSEGR